jgi:hypothetical protein
MVAAPAGAPVWVTGSVDVINGVFSASIGNISIDNLPAFQRVGTTQAQGVSGSLNVYTSGPQAVSGTVTVTQTGSFHVTVDNPSAAPAFQLVGTTQAQGVSGSVALTNWPAVIAVSGTVTANVTVTGSTGLQVAAPPGAPLWVTGSFSTAGSSPSQPTYISVTSSLPVSISGGQLPVIQQGTLGVSGTVYVTQTGSFHVDVDNFPPVQVVTGTVNVSGLVFSGTVQTIVARSTSHSTTNFAASLASQVAAGSDISRIGIAFFNVFGSSGNAYISLGGTASTGSYVACLLPGTYWSPDTLSQEGYSFIYDAIPGNLMVTTQD